MQIRVHLMSPKEDYPQIKYNLNVSKDSVQKTPFVISLFICTIQNKFECGFEENRS